MGSVNLSEKSMVASSWYHWTRKSFLLIGIWLTLSGSAFSGGLSEVDSSQVLEMLKRGVHSPFEHFQNLTGIHFAQSSGKGGPR